MTTDAEPLPAVTACGGKLKDASKYPSAEFEGRTIYFCNEACLLAFQGDPLCFMSGGMEHPD